MSTRSNESSTGGRAIVPVFYRLFFLYVEPFSALLGAIVALDAQLYLQLTHPGSSFPVNGVPIGTQVVLSQLANLYLLFAINEFLVLRSTSDLRVWRTLLLGLLIADFGHLYSVSKLGLDIYWRIDHWSAIDWGNIAFVYVGALTRITFLLGVGFDVVGREARI